MDAAKIAETAKWCEQQSRFLLADWEFQIRAGAGNRLPGAPALPGIRDELVQRLTEIEPSLAAVVENTYLFSRSDLAAVKLARWAELLRAMSPGAAEPAAVEEPAAAAGRTAPAASVNAQVIDLLCRRPESGTWSARQIATALRCSKSAVAESDAFKKLGTAREMARLARAERCQKANQRRDRK